MIRIKFQPNLIVGLIEFKSQFGLIVGVQFQPVLGVGVKFQPVLIVGHPDLM